MPNDITPYNPIFYANEALIQLEMALGMAGRVYRGYDEERQSFGRGDIISIRKPSSFVTSEGGTDNSSDLKPEKVNMTLDGYRQVKYELTDKELAYTSERIIEEHTRPAMYAIAEYINLQLSNLYTEVPWSYNESASFTSYDILNARKILKDNAGDAINVPGGVHMAVNSGLETSLLGLDVLSNASVTGQGNNQSLMTGILGSRWNVNFFTNQSLGTHTSGTVVSAGTDRLGSLTANVSRGATSIAVENFSLTETFKAGDSVIIAGSTQRYAITADVTLAAGAGTLSISPALKQDYSAAAVVTAETPGAANFADEYETNILFHPNAFAIAFAPLPEIGDGKGAQIATVVNPVNGLSVRYRIAYYDTEAVTKVTYDVLFGVKCLDPNLAVVYRRNA